MAKVRKRCLIDLLSSYATITGLLCNREQLLAAILCGDVFVAGEKCRDPKRQFPEDTPIGLSADSPLCTVNGMDGVPSRPFVSRGGEKLDGILESWQVPVAGRIWLDAGCSTGGFTHCLLLRGAALVHAVDVGYNVLDWRLRKVSQVRLYERTNIMGLEKLDPIPDAAVADLSFRSMQGAAAKILSLTNAGELYALIKPQFERKYAQNENLHQFEGVVNAADTQLILADVVNRLAGDGIAVTRIAPSPLKGRTGNQEYIALLKPARSETIDIWLSEGLNQVASLFIET